MKSEALDERLDGLAIAVLRERAIETAIDEAAKRPTRVESSAFAQRAKSVSNCRGASARSAGSISANAASM
jgi:hypothetical protein